MLDLASHDYYVLWFICVCVCARVCVCVCVFVVLDLVSLVPCQQIGREERHNDLFSVERNVKP